MTWDSHARQIARTPCTVVEIDLDWYDDAGDTVQAVNDDDTLCYRTPATTAQAADDFTLTTKTRRWMTLTVQPMPELLAIPCLQSAKISAEEIRIGRGLGNFGQVKIVLNDFVDDDRREDPFYSDSSRDDIDHDAGTYFGKLLARNPYLTGRTVRVIEGWATDGVWWPADVRTHTFQIRDIQGPSDGKVTITAAGPLQILNLNDTEAPIASRCSLLNDITDIATTGTLELASDAADYPASGYARIGDEIVSYTRVGAILTMNRDGHFGTTAAEHSAGDLVQVCIVYTDQRLIDILKDLLTTYGLIDESLLALDEWESEQTTWLTLYRLNGVISKPEKIFDLCSEILESSACILWWDDEEGKVRLRAMRPANISLGTWTDKYNFLKPVVINRDLSERVSRCDVLIELRSAALDTQDQISYRFRVVGETEGAEITAHRTEQVHLIATRFFSVSQIALAFRAMSQITEQLRDGRRTFAVEVAAKDAGLQLGDVLDIKTKDIVDRTGQPALTRCYVVKREPMVAGSTYKYLLEFGPFTGRFSYMTDVDCPDYDDAADWQRDPGAFMCNAAATIPYPPYLMG